MRFRSFALVPVLVLTAAACGDNAKEAASATVPSSSGTLAPESTATTVASAPTTTAPVPAVDKPVVKIPAALPTTLQITDLTKGSGRAAAQGDTIVLNYVGVRSADGVEFDSSYERNEPFTFTIGAGTVIAGWDQGLIGAQKGARRQLDIPSDLAYGDADQGDVIRAGDALTFVVDVIALLNPPDPANAPTDTAVTPVANTDSLTYEDLIVGNGDTAETGSNVSIALVAFNGGDGKLIDSSWGSGQPFNFALDGASTIPGIEQTVTGMKVGGRRRAVIPYELAFGESGNSNIGLPARTDLVVIIDLLATY